MINPNQYPGMHTGYNQMRPSSAPLEDDNVGKWEIDTTQWIDRIYNDLLGKKLEAGQWVNDPTLKRQMNEEGADQFVRPIRYLISKHMHFSNLSQQEIVEIATVTAENYSAMLEDNVERWEVNGQSSSLFTIAYHLYHTLYTLLQIAKEGGMKKHREKIKNPYMNMPQQPTEVI